VYLGLLNSTKELAGDFLGYFEIFQTVPKYNNPISYVMSFGKEPLYYAYTWLSYHLFMGNWKMFVISITTINYLLISYSLIRISDYLKVSSKNVIVALFFMAFFFQEMAVVGNLVRQSLSEAMILVFLTRLYLYKKRSWWIAICAFCVHTSCLPLLGIGIIPSIADKFTITSLLRLLVPLSFLVVGFYVLGDYMANIPILGYVFSRANNSEQLLGADYWQEDVGLSAMSYILLFLNLGMIAFLYSDKKRLRSKELGLINFSFILVILMFLCNAIGAYYLLMRYFFYVYVFQIPIFLLFMHYNRTLNSDVVRVPLMLTLVVYFFHEYTHNVFSYSSILEAMCWPAPVYLF